MKYLLYM